MPGRTPTRTGSPSVKSAIVALGVALVATAASAASAQEAARPPEGLIEEPPKREPTAAPVVAPQFGRKEPAPATATATATATGVELALRAGFGVPLGNATQGLSMRDAKIREKLPFRFDAGARVTPHVYVGLYLALGFAVEGGSSHSGLLDEDAFEAGVMVAYHVTPGRRADPWVGVGIGFEQFTAGASGVETYQGLTFFDLQVGVDLPVSERWSIGPVVSLAVGRYSSISTPARGAYGAYGSGGGVARDIPNSPFHEWLLVGVRGAYGTW
ncbi:MAG: hypothetical protein NVS3B10_17570 [Polyangiales bacterium]